MQLGEAGRANLIQGHYRSAERLARRAVITARGRLEPSAPLTHSAHFLHIRALKHLARYDEALDVVDALLPIEEKVNGSEHPDTLSTRHLRASILRNLARYDEALDAVDALLPVEVKVNGSEHPHTLTTRFLRVRILHDLAGDNEAHEALRILLPRMKASLPANHRRMKEAQWLWEQLRNNKPA